MNYFLGIKTGLQGDKGSPAVTLPPVTLTENITLTLEDVGKSFSNKNVSGDINVFLPEADSSNSLFYTFFIEEAESLLINGASGDIINLGITSGDIVDSSAVGSMLTIFNIQGSSAWFCMYVGTWNIT